MSRRPPNLRKPDNCGNCRFLTNDGSTCGLYNYVFVKCYPEDYTCDDYRGDY